MKPYFSFSLISKTGILLILLSACSTQEEIQTRKCTKALKHFEKVSFEQGCPWNGFDSSVSQKTIIMYRDSLIYVHIPGEFVHDSVLVPVADSISTEVSILSTKYAVSKAWIQNSRLQHTLEQVKTDIEKSVKGLNKEIYINKEKVLKIPYTVYKPVETPLSWLQKLLIGTGIAFWIALTAIIFIKIRLYLISKK